ncbi:hypothetical protein ACFL3P_00465 [Pseudomonadota bacterium]
MQRALVIFLTSLLMIAAGCSQELVKRTTYETLQNVRQQECSREPSVDCEKRDSLEVYEDKRQDVIQ